MEAHSKEDIPLTVLLSSEKSTRGMVTVFDEIAAIRAIKVHRNQINRIPETWKTGCGFYILVSDVNDGKFHSYVGKATQNNLHARVASHRREKENWTYAFLFQRDTSNGLTSTQASYVEGEIHHILTDCDWISVINTQIAGDKTLAEHEIFFMNQVVKSALRILNIFGYAMDETHEEEPAKPTESSGRKYYGVSIAALVKSGLLHEDEDLISLNDKFPTKATLGRKGVILDGKESSPSGAAASAIHQIDPGAIARHNGWNFWGVCRGDKWLPLNDFREHYLSKKALYENSLLTEKDIDFNEAVKSNEKNKQEEFERQQNEVASVAKNEAKLNEVIANDVLNDKKELDPERHKDSLVRIYHLIDAGLLEEGMTVVSQLDEFPVEAEIDGGIRFNGNVYASPTIAGKYARRIYDPTATEHNGWEFWAIKDDDGNLISLSHVLDDYIENSA